MYICTIHFPVDKHIVKVIIIYQLTINFINYSLLPSEQNRQKYSLKECKYTPTDSFFGDFAHWVHCEREVFYLLKKFLHDVRTI